MEVELIAVTDEQAKRVAAGTHAILFDNGDETWFLTDRTGREKAKDNDVSEYKNADNTPWSSSGNWEDLRTERKFSISWDHMGIIVISANDTSSAETDEPQLVELDGSPDVEDMVNTDEYEIVETEQTEDGYNVTIKQRD